MNIPVLAVLVGFMGLDNVKFGQFMISRPLVVGGVIGFLSGNFPLGLRMGVLLELLWIRVIPVGTFYPPDTVITTALASIWTISFSRFCPEGMFAFYALLSISLAIPVGIGYKTLQINDRKKASGYNGIIEQAIEAGEPDLIYRYVWMSLLKDFAVGGLFFLFFYYCGYYIVKLIPCPHSSIILKGVNYAFYLLPLLGITQVLNSFLRKKK